MELKLSTKASAEASDHRWQGQEPWDLGYLRPSLRRCQDMPKQREKVL